MCACMVSVLVCGAVLLFYSLFVCVCRKWIVWGSSYHFIGSGPETGSWNQSAIDTAEGECTDIHIL